MKDASDKIRSFVHIAELIHRTVLDIERAYREFSRRSSLTLLTATMFAPFAIASIFPIVLSGKSILVAFPVLVSIGAYFAYPFVAGWRGRTSLRRILLGRLAPSGVIPVSVTVTIIVTFLLPVVRHFAGLNVEHLYAGPIDNIVFACVVRPMAEEIAFQAWLQTQLQRFGPTPP